MRGVKKLDFDSSSHTVSAFSPSGMASISQVYMDHKSNEINVIKMLLEQIELKDTFISIDVMGTQTAIAEQTKEKGGKYLLGVKSNQKHTLQEVESYFCLFVQEAYSEDIGNRISSWSYRNQML